MVVEEFVCLLFFCKRKDIERDCILKSSKAFSDSCKRCFLKCFVGTLIQ